MRHEHAMRRILRSAVALVPMLLLAALAVPAAVAAAGPITPASSCVVSTGAVTCDLWAKPGSLSVPDGSVPIWGFSDTAGGSPTVPGPDIVATAGDTVTIHLTNLLPAATSLVFNGVAGAPDLASVAALTGTHTYTLTDVAPGTYLYEAGILPGQEYQVAMGLAGTLVVHPAGAGGQAYASGSTTFSTAYQDEARVLVSEIDPALNNNVAGPAAFDLRAFAPRYFLVNGHAYSASAPSIDVTGGQTLLLRYLNAGIQHHSMAVLGLHQHVIANDGSPLPAERTMVAETIAPGQTQDVLISVPATAATSTRYPVYDAALALNNSNVNGMGGMLAFIDATGSPTGTDTTGPVTSGVTLTLPGGALSAQVSDLGTGGSGVQAAEYFIDTTNGNGTGGSMSGPFSPEPATVSATIPAATIAALTHGTHTVYVHAQDSAANWGTFSSTTFTIDKIGPTVSALTLNPNPSSGGSVALAGTASDVASGNNNVTAAQYTIDGGPPLPMNVNVTAPTVSITATIPSGLAPGSYTIAVRATDAAMNLGPATSITLTVDGGGPLTTLVTATPAANNGSLGQSSGNPSVRITAHVSDADSGGSQVKAAEGFIDTVGAVGTGFPFTAADGSFNATIEDVRADIPLATINALTSGAHTIYVRGKDAVGSWGGTASLGYLIDRISPALTGISLSPNPTYGAAAIALTVNGALDPAGPGGASGVSGGSYWLDSAPVPAGGGTPFSGTSVSIPTAGISIGTHTVYARIRDVAGNWSAVVNATVVVVPDVIFANGFDTGLPTLGLDERVDQQRDPAQRDHQPRDRRPPEPPGAGQQHQLCPEHLRERGAAGHGHVRRPVLLPPERQHLGRQGHLPGRVVLGDACQPPVPCALSPERGDTAGADPGRRHRQRQLGHAPRRHLEQRDRGGMAVGRDPRALRQWLPGPDARCIRRLRRRRAARVGDQYRQRNAHVLRRLRVEADADAVDRAVTP